MGDHVLETKPQRQLFEDALRRVIEYGRFCRQPIILQTGVRSVFGRIYEMQENAAIYGDGAPTEQFLLDGELVTVRSDGGLGRLVSSQRSQIGAIIRAKEVHDAVESMRSELRRLVHVAWVDLPMGKDEQTNRAAADALGMDVSSYRVWRGAVLGILDCKLLLPRFQVVEDGEK